MKALPTSSMGLKSWLSPSRSFWSRVYKYTSLAKSVSLVLDLTKRPHFWHSSPALHLLSHQWPLTTRATTLWVSWGSGNICIWYLLYSISLPTEAQDRQPYASSRGSTQLHGPTWCGWTCRRVYSLRKWGAMQLDFLHCLVLVLCEEEEGHLEAMRSL